MDLKSRPATLEDVPLLTEMNIRLIRDEKHRNPMSAPALEKRMRHWLRSREYEGRIFYWGSDPVAYVLFHQGPLEVYIRHFFVEERYRRQGLGRSAMESMVVLWGKKRIRVEVLVRNQRAVAFWRKCGFADYALTLEREP